MILPKSNDACWCGSGKKFKRCHKDIGPAASLTGGSVTLVKPGNVSPVRSVPAEIARPDYVSNGGKPKKNTVPLIKNAETIERMRRAGHAAAEVLRKVKPFVQPGITTDELDGMVHDAYIELGGYPSTLGYGTYRKSCCTSVNEVICHGIPDDRPLEDGDIVNIDVTIFLDGVHGDHSETYLVGDVDPVSRRLVAVTEESMYKGIDAVKPGRPVSDIGRAIQDHAEKHGYSVIQAFVGHGIGEIFHMPPSILHYYDRNARDVMAPGMTFTIEPMISLGSWDFDTWDDGWTAVTKDRSRTAQFEHTVLVTNTGVEILTR
jgi:methionyl aminopeptidase